MQRSSRLLIAFTIATSSLCAARVEGQVRGARDSVARVPPREVQREAIALFNSSTLRARGRTVVDSGRTLTGDVAVLDGPAIIAGRVTGRVVAINADVLLRRGARIDGDLVVVGGEIEGLREVQVGGETRRYPNRLPFVDMGDTLALSDDELVAGRDQLDWWRRLERRRTGSRRMILVGSSGAYNRVEGLPVNVGPQIRHTIGDAQLTLDAFVVLRTQTSFRTDSNEVGWDTQLELRPRRRGLAIGGRAYDVNAPAESWQMGDLEVGLASFLMRRDYRDYYNRRGGSGYLALVDAHWGELSIGYGHERWSPRADVDPWSLFRPGAEWRPNPLLDEGRMHLLTLRGRLDTRNDPLYTKDGWLLLLDVERGVGRLTEFGFTTPGVRIAPLPDSDGAKTRYLRGVMDLRRYMRVSPHGQLNLRAVLGGWLAGDELPLQRRLSVDGPGVMPGYGFRRTRGLEAGICATDAISAAGLPAQCERIALAQVEARGDIRFALNLFGYRVNRYPEWVGFMDVGRGWLVRNDEPGSAGFSSSTIPPLSTFRSDIGGGLDFGPVGIYLAKALSHAEPPVAFVRLQRRF